MRNRLCVTVPMSVGSPCGMKMRQCWSFRGRISCSLQAPSDGASTSHDVSRFPMTRFTIVTACLIGLALGAMQGCGGGGTEGGGERTITLKLGGQHCEFYSEEVKSALTSISGVTNVDLETKDGHALVTAAGSVAPDDLVDAVNGVKGEGWHCEASQV